MIQITKLPDAEGRVVVAVVSDVHINSTVGISPRSVKLDNGGIYTPSKFQLKLLECWEDYWGEVKKEKGNDKLVVVINGDLIEGDHHRTSEIISSNLSIQHKMAMEILEPIVDIADVMFIVRGTEAHDGKSSMNLENIATSINAVPEKDFQGNFTHWHLVLNIQDTVFDILHHGSIGRLPWTKSNIANRIAIETELLYYRSGFKPPTFVLRGHNHQWADSSMMNPVRVFFLGCWQGLTAHTYKVAPGQTLPSALPSIGGMIFSIDNGTPTFRIKNYTNNGIGEQ